MQTTGNGKKEAGVGLVASLAAEHERLGKLIATVRALNAEESFSWDAARTSITGLRESLEAHFTTEEAGGYLAEVVAEAPEKSHVVAKLESDHSRMRGMLASLLAEALVARSRDDLRKHVEQFLAVLADHERRENELVVATFSTDIPATD